MAGMSSSSAWFHKDSDDVRASLVAIAYAETLIKEAYEEIEVAEEWPDAVLSLLQV